MANTFKFGNKNWAWKEGSVLAYNDENNNFKPLPFDFTRSSSATRVNKDGLIEVVGSDEPRVDYLNNADGHLLLEPSRGNEFTYSNTSVLITGRCTRGDAYTKLGIVDGYEYSVSTSNPNLYLNYTESTLGYKTFSVFIDATNSDYFKIHLATGGGSNNGAFATFTPSTQSFGSITENATYVRNSSVGYDYFGNNIYRIWITTEFILYSGGTTFPLIYFGDNTNVWIGGGQVEKGSYATSYIPTSGSSVTRAVDRIEQSGFQGKVLNATQGTIFIHFNNPMADGDNNDFHMFRSTSSTGIENGFLYRLNTGTGVDILERVANSTGAQFSNIVSKGQVNKIAISFTSSTLLGSANGSTKSYSGTYLGTEIDIDEFENSGSTEQGLDIIDIKFYDTALTQEELNALTTL